tara:strand:- start:1657 stop:2199 length:543 start_codon:yes stop_codon:yes gene_type:complete
MKGVRAASRYAKAIYHLAQSQGILEAVVIDFQLIRKAIKESDDLEMLLKSPLINAENKKTALTSIFQGKVQKLTMKSIIQTVNQGREVMLALICEELIEIYNKANHIAAVKITTASPLDESTRNAVLKGIKDKYNFSKINLIETIDKELIGGILLRIGDLQLDASIRRQLNDIKKELVQA